MAPSPGRRGPARRASGGDRSARSLRTFAEEAERDRSDLEQLARLLRNTAAGDPEALKQVFNENLGMVLREAHARAVDCEGTVSEDELLQEGSAALVAAIRDYATGDGAATGFLEFAGRRVADGMAAAVAEQRAADRDHRQLLEDAEAYERAEISIRRDKMREPTNAELAEKLEWSPEKTSLLGEMVADARRLHDEELLEYIDPEELTELDDE